MKLGKTQTLKIAEINNSGAFLESENGERAFLPKIFLDENAEIENDVEVFVYQDDDKLKATTEIPSAEVGEFAVMNCVQSLPSGAFMDWGIIKDLFIPYKQQKGKILEGKRYLVYIYVDEVSGRITGTTKFKRNQNYENVPFKAGDKVDLIINYIHDKSDITVKEFEELMSGLGLTIDKITEAFRKKEVSPFKASPDSFNNTLLYI